MSAQVIEMSRYRAPVRIDYSAHTQDRWEEGWNAARMFYDKPRPKHAPYIGLGIALGILIAVLARQL